MLPLSPKFYKFYGEFCIDINYIVYNDKRSMCFLRRRNSFAFKNLFTSNSIYFNKVLMPVKLVYLFRLIKTAFVLR